MARGAGEVSMVGVLGEWGRLHDSMSRFCREATAAHMPDPQEKRPKRKDLENRQDHHSRPRTSALPPLC